MRNLRSSLPLVPESALSASLLTSVLLVSVWLVTAMLLTAPSSAVAARDSEPATAPASTSVAPSKKPSSPRRSSEKTRASSASSMRSNDRASVQAPSATIELEVGHAHVLKVPSARQVAVGNSQTLQANAASPSEVILFGKHAGSTTVDIWDHSGKRESFQVEVQPAGKQQTMMEIRSLIAGMDGVSVRSAGNHIVLQAHGVTTMQRDIIEKVLSRYPDVVDMTGSVSWDPMVMLDVLVIELPTYRLSELGVRWEAAEGSGGVAGLAWQVGRAALPGGTGQAATGPADQTVGSLRRPEAWMGLSTALTSQLHALADRGEAVLLAQPQLVTRTGKAATFLAGGEVPYAVTDTKGRTHTEFKKYGVALNVTPELGPGGRILASVEVEVSAVDPSIVTSAGPAMRVRKASTQFNAYSGQTMVLAGFMSSDRSNSYRGAPSPQANFFERLLGVQEERSRQTELAILVTPVVLDADHPSMRNRARLAKAYADVETAGATRITLAGLPADPVQVSEWVTGFQTNQQPGSLERRPEQQTDREAALGLSGQIFHQGVAPMTGHEPLVNVWERYEPETSSGQWGSDDQ